MKKKGAGGEGVIKGGAASKKAGAGSAEGRLQKTKASKVKPGKFTGKA